jgi:DNA processing protein
MEKCEGVVTIKDKRYPRLLKKLGKEAPTQLYYKGNWDEELFDNCLAVVGSRRMTTYGRQVVEKIVGQVASERITVVSGFMYGVDAMAHKTAVDAGGKTMAVMPCGIELVHPEEQVKLYDEILESGGLIISEYNGKMQPALYTYPARNRIVAGLSKAVLVVEAAEKSGSLITANLAKKFKKKLFAVPGPVTSLVSKGTNDLIKSGDAEMVLGAEDILKWFGKSQERSDLLKTRMQILGGRTSLEQQIVSCLQNEPMEMDLLARSLKKSVAELNIAISMMEMNSQIKNINGKYYIN